MFGIESPGRMRQDLYAQLSASPGAPTEEFWVALRDAVRAYPADPYFPLLGSSAALAAGQNAVPWISRALERKPTSAQAHLQLGRILQARGASSQAGGALRRAIELDPEQLWAVLRLGKEWHWSTAALEAAAPDGAAGAAFVYRLAGQTEAVGERLRLLEQAVSRDPMLVDAHHQLAWELLQDVVSKHAGVACAEQRDACLARAAEHAKHGSQPGSARTGILEARILVEQGRPKEAEDHLAHTCEHVPGDRSCGDALVAQALANDSPRLNAAVKGLVATACSNRERCGQTHLHLGNQFANAGQLHIALSHYRHAAEETPSAEVWHTLAVAAERLGQETVAADARRRMGLLEAVDARHPVPAPAKPAEPSPHPAPLDQESAGPNSAAQSPGEPAP
jgi:Flp pilus assembly protein TadD